MRVGWEFHPNQSRATMHVDRKLFRFFMYGKEELTAEQRELVESLEETLGVAEVSINGYQVSVQRGAVFEWDEVMPRVEQVVAEWTGDEVVRAPVIGSGI